VTRDPLDDARDLAIIRDARDLARRLGALPFVDVVWLFGSAARGTADFASDLDLCVSAPHVSSGEWSVARQIVEAAPTLRRVDLLRWEELAPSDPLRARVRRDRVALYEREPGLSDRADDFAAAHPLLLEALARLREGLAEPGALDHHLMRDGVVQRFEFTTEQFWKTLRLALAQVGLAKGIAPRASLRLAVAAGWLDEATGELFDGMIDDRNRTSHTYRKRVADEVLARVPAHLARMEELAARLPGLVA
jgi:nucleotidyltransferase substrate binding protein (TIGR01987 family)